MSNIHLKREFVMIKDLFMYFQFARVYLSKEVSRSLFELARQSSKRFKLNSPNQIVGAGNAASVGHFTCHSNKFEFPETRATLMMMRG